MQAGRDGRYVAAEAKAGAGITGERRGGDYVLTFRRPVGRATALLAPRFATRFTLLAPDTRAEAAPTSACSACRWAPDRRASPRRRTEVERPIHLVSRSSALTLVACKA